VDYRHAADLAARAGAPVAQVAARRGLGEIPRLRGQLARARRSHEATLRLCGTDWASAEIRSRLRTALGHIAVVEGDSELARGHYRAALALTADPANLPIAASAVEGLAGLAALDGDGERAAVLLGAGQALRGVSIPGDPDVARAAAAARDLIGAAFDAAFERGAALSRSDALSAAGG
jgi:hypothetical protein